MDHFLWNDCKSSFWKSYLGYLEKWWAVSIFHFFFCSQDSRSLAGTEDKETFLVTLTKPCLYVQQVAFDKGENIKMI